MRRPRLAADRHLGQGLTILATAAICQGVGDGRRRLHHRVHRPGAPGPTPPSPSAPGCAGCMASTSTSTRGWSSCRSRRRTTSTRASRPERMAGVVQADRARVRDADRRGQGRGWPRRARPAAPWWPPRSMLRSRAWFLLRAARPFISAGSCFDDPGTIDAAARDAGIDPADLARWSEDEAVDHALREDMALAREPLPAARVLDQKLANWSGGRRYTCPSLRDLRRSDGVRIAVPGFQPFAAYDVCPPPTSSRSMPRRDPPFSGVREVLDWALSPRSRPREVAAILDVELLEAREELVRAARRSTRSAPTASGPPSCRSQAGRSAGRSGCDGLGRERSARAPANADRPVWSASERVARQSVRGPGPAWDVDRLYGGQRRTQLALGSPSPSPNATNAERQRERSRCSPASPAKQAACATNNVLRSYTQSVASRSRRLARATRSRARSPRARTRRRGRGRSSRSPRR